jgi:AcrR family transcriptional regulator
MEPTVPKRGRPSDALIDGALIDAALKEFLLHGYASMSMESIASRAGVSKVSLYRRWDSKIAIVGALLETLSQERSLADLGSLEADLRALLGQASDPVDARAHARIVMRTIGEIAANPELVPLYRDHLLEPRLKQLRKLVTRAKSRGELRDGVPVDVVCTMISGPLLAYYLGLLAEAELKMSKQPLEQLTAAILRSVLK